MCVYTKLQLIFMSLRVILQIFNDARSFGPPRLWDVALLYYILNTLILRPFLMHTQAYSLTDPSRTKTRVEPFGYTFRTISQLLVCHMWRNRKSSEVEFTACLGRKRRPIPPLEGVGRRVSQRKIRPEFTDVTDLFALPSRRRMKTKMTARVTEHLY